VKLLENERAGVELRFFGRILDESLYQETLQNCGATPGLFFEGELSYDDYVEAMLKSDMVIIPSRSDTLPLVSLNALCAGVPLMCTSHTGTTAYLEDGVSGYIIPSATVDDILTTLRRALGCQDRWSDIAAAGRKIFDSHFAQEKFQTRLESFASEISAKTPESP